MTNSEFINREIEECNKVIEQLKNRIIEDKKYPTIVKSHKEEIKNITKLKQRFLQIKNDLEAWEVVKKYLFVDKNIFEEDWEEFEYEYIRFINENICPMHGSNFEEIDIIKKALEVEE